MNSEDFIGIRNNGALPDPSAVSLPCDIGDLLDDYLESTESQLNDLEQAILRFEAGQDLDQDAAEIRRILHKIKGESGMVGLDDIAALVHEVENAFDELSEDMNGYEAASALKEQGNRAPVVALTADAMKGDDQKCLAAGCDDYLAKPIDHRELTRIIGKYLPSKQDVSSQTINSATAQASDPERLCSEQISYQPQSKVKQL